MSHACLPAPLNRGKPEAGFTNKPAYFLKCISLVGAVYCCLLAASQRVEAQTDFFARLWQTENGLPNNIVQAIAQTSDGYLWIGTREGLARFDGDQFDPVALSAQTTEPSINCLLAGRDGSLWIGTDGRGLFHLCRGELQRCEIPGLQNINFSVLGICEAGDHSVWFETPDGIYTWINGRIESQAGRYDSKRPQPELGSGKKPICADATGKIWVLNGNLVRADLPVATNYFAKSDPLPNSNRTLYCDRDGVFWIGTDSSASNVLIRVQAGEITKYPRQNGPAGFPQVISRDSAGNLWVGSYEGLSRLVDGKFVAFTARDDSASASAYKIYAIVEDREHNLWIGSDEGLTRLTPKRFKTITKKDGLASNVALAVCASSDGSTWISSWGSGLSHYVNGKIEVLNTTNGLPSNFVMALAETRDGSLWAGLDYNGPLVRVKGGKISVFEHKGHHGTPALYEDERGVLWIGNRGCLETWDGVKFKRFTSNNGLGSDEIDALCGGAKGSVWIGTVGGLSRWRDGKIENLGATNPQLRVLILSLYQDADKTLWIGTKGRGLLRWREGKVSEFNQKCGLFSDSIYAILEDAHTNLWFNSSRGIFWVNKQQIEAVAEGKETAVKPITYGMADGILSSAQYNDDTQPAACKDKQGRLWFRTTQGVTSVDPETAIINDQPPPILIQSITADNKPIAVGKLGLTVPGAITIPPGNGSLEIQYAALSYRAPEKNMYRYQLIGVDPDWVDAGDRRAAKYNNLPPGKYRFKVVASNNDGVWNRQGQAVELRLEPHFWQTWWFYSLLGLAATGLVGGAARYITRRRMQRKLNQLEKQRAVEQERSRIARDVHDELGAKLTSISFQGSIAKSSLNNPEEIKQQIEQMSESAREAVSSLHEIVWAADPLNDSTEGLVGHISHQVGELFGNSAIHYEVIVPENLPLLHLSANVRHNLFLATMEAANNAAKHSQATHVSIQVVLRSDELEIMVFDNGSGFDISPAGEVGRDKAKRYGSGLINMRKRLSSIGGQCEISSDAKSGTTIHFIVPLPAGGS